MSATKTLFDSIPSVRFNPSAIQRRFLAMVDEKIGGKFDLVDVTNPFMMLVEGASTLCAAACTDGEGIVRKMYESMAVTEEELFLHMSDRDYLGRFATPARATFSWLLLKDDILRAAQPAESGNYRKLVIPKHTEFTALDMAFTMQYPIEIRIHPHGGIDAVYVADEVSPVETLASNIVDKRFTQLLTPDPQNPSPREFLRLNIPVQQFKISPQRGQLNVATTFKKTYEFKDQFFYARVYVTNNSGKWVEITTTHTDQVYDPTVPTAVLRVIENKLQVMLPQVYMTNGLVGGEIRTDIYTTKGSLDIDIRDLSAQAYGFTLADYDQSVDRKYWAPISDMTMTLLGNSMVIGGSDKIDFAKFRERVLSNAAGSVKIPITDVQKTSSVETFGYDIVTHVDNVTNRAFLATRLLPIPTEGAVVSSAGLSIEMLAVVLERIADLPTVVDNGNRLTILPETVYTTRSGVTEIVPKMTIDSILALPVEERAERVNKEQFTFTPFHYVLDINDNRFATRAYYLDNPEVKSRNFVATNNTLGMTAGTRRFAISKNASGYKLSLEVVGDDSWDATPDDQVFCQLGFVPHNEIDLAYLNGTLAGYLDGNRIFEFQIDTNYDIDTNNNIAVTSFAMYADGPRTHFCKLDGEFTVIYGVSGVTDLTVTPSRVDLDLNTVDLPARSFGLTEETLNIELGKTLDGLWTSSRSVPSTLDYKRHTVDVPAFWENTVYKYDSTGAKEIVINNGQVEFVILHHAGDPKLDQNGDPIYTARAGDIMYDNDGNPVIENTRKMLRQTDILTVDGLYYFATEPTSVSYKNMLADLISSWVTEDIVKINEIVLEQTRAYFYPKVTYGYVDALVQENKQIRLRADQKFVVTLYVSGAVDRDIDLKVNLAMSAKMAINTILQNQVVTSDALIDAVAERMGSSVIGVTVSGLGGEAKYDAITLLDDSARLSIAKRCVAYPDGTLGVEDAVDVLFVRHRE